MSMTQQDVIWHQTYEGMSDAEREAIDEAWKEVRLTLNTHGFRTSNSDPAECLVAAIARYLMDSRRE